MADFPDICASNYNFVLAYNTQNFESPLTRSTQTASLTGDQWQAVVTYSNKTGADARTLKAFILGLKGQVGRFNFTPPDLDQQSEATGNINVNGAGQLGDSLNISAMPIAFDPSNEQGNMRDLVISNDGMRLFIIGTEPVAIHQYNLQDAFSLAVAVYSGESLSVNSQDLTMTGITVSADGSTIFLVGNNTNRIFQYDMTSANDLSTASYSGKDFNVGAEATGPQGISVSTGGDILYVGGQSEDTIFQYDMTSANDLSTASYSGKSLSVLSEEATLRGIAISSTGSQMFVTGIQSDRVHQYDLTISGDLDTASYSGNSLDISTQTGAPSGVSISSDGLNIYLSSTSSGAWQYTMTVSNDISTASINYSDVLLFGIGDYFTVNGELKSVLADSITDSAGLSVVSFAPPLRKSPADSAQIEYEKPFMIAKLENDDQASFQVSSPIIYNASFSIVEVF